MTRKDPSAAPLPPLTSASYLRQKEAQSACMDPQKLAAALAAGLDPNEPFDINGLWTPLHCALSTSPPSAECVRMLLAAGADPGGMGCGGPHGARRPIEEAISRSHNSPEHMDAARALACSPLLPPEPPDLLSLAFYAPELAAELRDRGFDPNALSEKPVAYGAFHARPTCLGAALALGTVGSHLAARALLAVGADPNGAGGGIAPLSACLRREGTAESIRELLEAGADPRRRDPDGKDALDLAREARGGSGAASMLPAIEALHRALSERDAVAAHAGAAPPSRPAIGSSL